MKSILAFALIFGLAGCTSQPKAKIQPAPPPYRDNKTPVALSKPIISQRITAQRIQDARIAAGEIAVEGQIR